MVKGKYVLLFLVLVFLVVFATSVFAGGLDTGYADDETVAIGGGEGGEDDEETGMKGKTTNLYMKIGLACVQNERDATGGTPTTDSSSFTWFDGCDNVDDDKPEGKIGYSFAQRWVYNSDGRMNFNPYEWSEYKKAGYEPFIELDLNWSDPREIRYEGDCKVYVYSANTKYPGQSEDSDKKSKGGKFTYYIGKNQDPGPGEKKKVYDFDRNINWDANKADCELIGGEWLDDEVDNPETYEHGTRGSYRCCGDDWIWLYNRPINYDSSIDRTNPKIIEKVDNQELCLYNLNNYGTPVDVEGLSTENPNYRCHKAYGGDGNSHVAYDPTLELDELTREDPNRDGVMARSDDNFFFAGPLSSSYETDIGKWSNNDASQAMFCYHQFNTSSENGEDFSWISIEKAAQKNQLICEAYLGYNWTGSNCCFDDMTYNDSETSCNSKEIIYGLSPEFSSPEFEEDFFEECDLASFRNPACLEGSSVENNTAVISNESKREVYNLNGELFFCNRTQGNQIYEDFEHVPKCALKGPEEYPFICAYHNDSWYDTYNANQLLGWQDNGSTGEQIENGLGVSSLPEFESFPDNLDPDVQQKECCYFGSCWNGTKCVSAQTNNGFYQVVDNQWGPMMGGVTEDKKNFMCFKGEWLERSPEFNWYYDTSPQRVSLCPDTHSCACSGGETAGYDYSCGEENVNEFGCTIEENFYKEDHFCEATYDDSDEVKDSRWTSRTKLIALQLKRLAQGSDNYTLFCDDIDYAVNSPGKLKTEAMPYDINKVCVIEFDGKTAMGLSFNADKDSENPVDSFLFGNGDVNNGFARVVENNLEVNGCDFGEPSDSSSGTYKKCIGGNNKIWANSKTNSIIYSKEGLNIGDGQLPKPSQNGFDNLVQEIVDVVQNNDDSDLPEAAYLITTASNFNRLYMLKKGEKEAFGFIETRRDPAISADDDTPLRNFVAVKYSGFTNVCNDISFVRERDDILLYCNEQGGENFVLGRSRDAHPDYWKNLAPKIRVI
ncbi:MAG: hypothetical protein ACQESF_00160 [Nanobdellota archaeon]